MAYIVPMHVKPKFTYLLTYHWFMFPITIGLCFLITIGLCLLITIGICFLIIGLCFLITIGLCFQSPLAYVS